MMVQMRETSLVKGQMLTVTPAIQRTGWSWPFLDYIDLLKKKSSVVTK